MHIKDNFKIRICKMCASGFQGWCRPINVIADFLYKYKIICIIIVNERFLWNSLI